LIAAPPERCFDLALSVELHLEAAAGTGERVVAGVSSGILELGDEVTWEARHLGQLRRLSVRISAHDRPHTFRDELVRGPLRHFVHDHVFEHRGQGTRMIDRLEFASRLRLVDALVLTPHLRRFLTRRNDAIRRLAESEGWRMYLDPPAKPARADR
jgi:ligand-binding SRPBCC domain-containing protein